MNIHEYQGKAVLKEIGAPVSKGIAIFKPEEAQQAAEALDSGSVERLCQRLAAATRDF